MRILRYAALLLVFLAGADVWGQYNPTNPTEPGAAPWKLTLRSVPADAGSFNRNTETYWAEGTKVSLTANNNGGYIFQQWETAAGETVSEKASFSIVMAASDTVLVARYVYRPSNPSEPDAPAVVRYGTLCTVASPQDGGSTNHSDIVKYEVGSKVTLRANNNSNFVFVNWTEDGQEISTSSTLSNYQVTEGNHKLTANFRYAPGSPEEPAEAVVSHPLYLKANPAGACTFNITSGVSYKEGANITVRAYAQTYYTFKNWSLDGEVISSESEFNFTMPKRAATLVANYSYNYNPGNPSEPGAASTERHHLYGMHENGIPGQVIKYPVYLENTSSVTGFSIDVAFPAGMVADAANASLTERTGSHTIEVQELGENTYRFFVRGSETIAGANGKVLEVPLAIPATEVVGTNYTIGLSKGAVFKADGSQNVVTVRSGSLTIQPSPDAIPDSPDFTVSDIRTTENETGPGQLIHLSWKVNNIGQLEANSGWSERIYLVSSTGKKVCIGNTYYDTTSLAAGSSVSREADIALGKLLGIEGETYVSITIVPNAAAGEISERQGNNTADSKGSTLQVSKQLYLTVPTTALTEGETSTVKCQLARSGNWTATEVFNLSVQAGDARLQVPATVSIPKEQSSVYFYLTIEDNALLDENAQFTIQAAGNGYAAVTGELVIEDDELPGITVTPSKSEVAEGDELQLTVTIPRAAAQDLSISLVAEYPKRFDMPSVVTIPAGQTSATVKVSVNNDDTPSIQLSNAFTASAEGYTNGEAIVILNDDDIPALELALTPNQVSEGAGVAAVAGILRRTGKTDNKVTVKLTDNADGGLYFGNRTLELAKGVEEIHFNFGPVDNAKVDGDRKYTITAAVWVSSCNCSAAGESAGSVSAVLYVFDDDGATLSVTTSAGTVKEGGKTTLTITHNTSTDQALTVTLNSDYDENLTYSHTVTIPVGQKSETVEVTSKANDISGDSHTVVFTAAASGYSSGTCYLMVTDQTLPDARISSIATDKQESIVGENVKLAVTVANDGAAALPEGLPVKVYLRGEPTAITTLYTQTAIAVGGEEVITKTLTLPMAVGKTRYYAVVNETHNVSELSYTNNTSSEAVVNTIAPFTVTVSTDKKVYRQGDKVLVTGRLTGKDTSEADVDLYMIYEGARQVKTVKTDAQGAFSHEWDLYALQSGHFSVGACYPDEGLSTEMTAFDVYGLRRTSNEYVKCDVDNGTTFTGSINIANPGNLSLTGVTVETLSVPGNCEAAFSVPATIAGGETVKLSYSLKGLEPSAEVKWDEVKARIKTAEGVSLDISLYYYCRQTTGRLEPLTKKISTTMTKGKSREYLLQIVNTGRGNTGNITLALPAFIKSLAGNTLPSLDQNDTLSIALRLTPTADMQLNVTVTGQLGINCDNGDGAAVSFSITPVSEETGTLTIDVCDEYTYYTSEAPHVADAEVVVRNPVTNALVTQGKTDANGKFSVVLPEGYYKVSVTANKHDSYSNNICVDPGKETINTVNLSVESITVDWKVEEVEIEDEYEIVTTVKYETNVPMPVVEMIVPQKLDVESLGGGESLVFTAVLTNRGLIKAEDAELILPTDLSGVTLEPLAEYKGLTIAPQQSVFIPVKLTRSAVSGSRMRKASKSGISCSIHTGTLYYWDCGNDRKWHQYGVDIQIFSCSRGSLDPSSPSRPGSSISWPDGGGPGGPGSPSGPGGSNYTHTSDNNNVSRSVDTGCEPCQNQFIIDLVDCGLQLVPAYRVLKAVISCAQDCMSAVQTFKDETATPVKKAGAILSAITTCSSARHAGSGDKDATREQKREEAIESILETLGGIVGKIAEGEAKETYSWDGIVETVGSLASSLTSLAGFDFDNLEQMFCPLKLFKPCDKEGDTQDASGVRRKETSKVEHEYPSYVGDFRRSLSYGLVDMMALTGMKVEVYGDKCWLEADAEQLSEFLTDFTGMQNENGVVSDDKWEELASKAPYGIDKETVIAFVKRWNNTVTDSDGDKIDIDKALDYYHVIEVSEQEVIKSGYDGIDDCVEKGYDKAYKNLEQANSSVCASITLQFKQTMVMTRQAFRGTLTVFNGNETTAMTDMKLTLNVNSSTGHVATSHEFQINPESLDGFTGELSLTSGWTLKANSTGTATILFIPTKYAAPTEPVDYSFGGTLSYVDPFTGLQVTRELYPVTMTVKPSPELDLTYFMQRDIYGDDALTLDVVEPSVPAEFALLINNKGNGDATNVRMVTQQPEIIDNEKGLYIDFEIVSSQVNGNEANLAFGKSITNDFGTIPAHSQAYAQWWLTSTLLGHFTEYDVKASHLTSYGNEDLSLLGDVSIHEMIRSLDLSADGNKMVGFLVNDITDSEDLPDMLYLSNGETKAVSIASESRISKTSRTTYSLTVTPSDLGWAYGSIKDPTQGMSELKRIVRQRDGKEINLRNFWQTDRTLQDGKEPLYEYRIHFADEFGSTSPETYILTFDPLPDVVLDVESIESVPEKGTIAVEPIKSLTVKFTKSIDPATFTSEDITFAVQGVRQDTKQIGISTEDNVSFSLDMAELAEQSPNGYYAMTIQTAGITDTEGYQGKAGKQTDWILFRGGLVQLLTSAWPVNSGSVEHLPEQPSASRRQAPATGTENTAKYGSTVTLVAKANKGYEFANWTLNGEVVSNATTYEALAINDLNVVANFVRKSYEVNIQAEGEGGTVTGSSTGIYEYETPLELTAVPEEDYAFSHWIVNGKDIDGSDNSVLAISVDSSMTIEPVFIREYYRQTLTLSKGWNWLSTYLNESMMVSELPSYVVRILGQTDELINDPQYGMVGNLTTFSPGKAYKLQASRMFSNTFRGHRFDAESLPIALQKGWNWIAYPHQKEAVLNHVITNAAEGDFITSQTGFAEYTDGNWAGTLETLVPGNGYLYKSTDAKKLALDFSAPTVKSRNLSPYPKENGTANISIIDVHRYPNTMNMTIRLLRNGQAEDVGNYNIYAFADGELRGVGQPVGDNLCLTVYGYDADPITFVVESADSGEVFEVKESTSFRNDVVGSRKHPYSMNIGNATGINTLGIGSRPMTVYSIQGILISNHATLEMLYALPKGVYIVNGQKYFVK